VHYLPRTARDLSLAAAVCLAAGVVGDARAAAQSPGSPEHGLPAVEPLRVGMATDRLAAVDRVVRKGITGGGFPGAAVVIGRKGSAVVRRGYGNLEWTGPAVPVTTDRTIFDVASLTKVIVTTTATMILVDEGRLRLDAPVRQYLPEFSGTGKDAVTIRMLLTHRSGLPAGRVLFGNAKSPAHAKQLVLQTPLQCTPGSCFVYSDLGPAILGWVVERVAGLPLDRFAETRIFAPLGMRSTMFRPAESLRPRIAPTQHASRRGYPLRGEVHDESAYVLGGVSGHAGLFSTADDIAVFAQMLLNGGEYNGRRIVADSTIRLFTTHVASARALGWEVANGVRGAGDLLSPIAFGHTGYTGTSIWIDPERELFIVLLTNRTFAPRTRNAGDLVADVRNDLADVATLAVENDPWTALLQPRTRWRSDTATTWNVVNRPAWRAAAANPKLPPPGPRLRPAAPVAPGVPVQTPPGFPTVPPRR
jgi:CubicO group peptidase (beta-lactamase class C family)